MTLGLYWYYHFPDGLYAYDFMEFKAGYGGHSNTVAELSVTVETEKPDEFISSLKELVIRYDEAFLIVEQEGPYLRISSGGYQLWDYDFLFMEKVEQQLREQDLEVVKDHKLENPAMLKLGPQRSSTEIDIPKNRWLQLVSSAKKKHNAECSLIRLDCHVSREKKLTFIDDLSNASKKTNLNVFYYNQKEARAAINLMLFFTNGRQGLELSSKMNVDIHAFENDVESVMRLHEVQTGHIGEREGYPLKEPVIERITDREFII